MNATHNTIKVNKCGDRLRKGHGLDLQPPSLHSLSQAAVLQGWADLLEMNGSPRPSQGTVANEADPQLGGGGGGERICLCSWQHLRASEPSS